MFDVRVTFWLFAHLFRFLFDSLRQNFLRFWQADGESEKTSIRTKTALGQLVEDGQELAPRYNPGYHLQPDLYRCPVQREKPFPGTPALTVDLSGSVDSLFCLEMYSAATVGRGWPPLQHKTKISFPKKRDFCITLVIGGDKRDRTADLLNAIQALSQRKRCATPLMRVESVLDAQEGWVTFMPKYLQKESKIS